MTQFNEVGGRRGQHDVLHHFRHALARRKAAGFDQQALDTAAYAGFSNGTFEDSIEDGAALVDEFYPDAGRTEGAQSGTNTDTGNDDTRGKPAANAQPASSSLRRKLERKTALLGAKTA